MNVSQMHVVDIEEVADPEQFNAIKLVNSDRERDTLVSEGWTLCQTETAIIENMGAIFKGMEDGTLRVHVLGRNT